MENYTKRGTPTQYSIRIDNTVYQKIQHWVHKATGEVSGLGKLIIDKTTGVITIKSAILLKQENGAASTDIDANAVAKAMFETRNDEGMLNFWWHSHVNMDVFWSTTDIDTIRQIGDQGFVVATVFNKKNELLSCLYRKADELFPETFIDEIPTGIVNNIPAEVLEIWDKDFEEKCKPKTYAPVSYGGGDYAELRDRFQNFRRTRDYMEDQDIFDFDDIPTTNDAAKMYAIQPQLVILGEQMEQATTRGMARKFINLICHRINNLKLTTDEVKRSVKEPYLKKFNTLWGKTGETQNV